MDCRSVLGTPGLLAAAHISSTTASVSGLRCFDSFSNLSLSRTSRAVLVSAMLIWEESRSQRDAY